MFVIMYSINNKQGTLYDIQLQVIIEHTIYAVANTSIRFFHSLGEDSIFLNLE